MAGGMLPRAGHYSPRLRIGPLGIAAWISLVVGLSAVVLDLLVF
jgi:hypothetical protein